MFGKKSFFPIPSNLVPKFSLLILIFLFSEHTQDKHIQRDDEYYDGDNDNDQMNISWSAVAVCLLAGDWPF